MPRSASLSASLSLFLSGPHSHVFSAGSIAGAMVICLCCSFAGSGCGEKSEEEQLCPTDADLQGIQPGHVQQGTSVERLESADKAEPQASRDVPLGLVHIVLVTVVHSPVS
jgi:hypothetical protein